MAAVSPEGGEESVGTDKAAGTGRQQLGTEASQSEQSRWRMEKARMTAETAMVDGA